MKAPHNVPIYLVDVLVYIYDKKEFVEDMVVKRIVIKGFGKKYIKAFRYEELKKRTFKEISLPKGHNFKVVDFRLQSQHGFGVNDLN